MPLKHIWAPDTIIINSASGDGYLKINADFSYVSVYYTGDVFFISEVIGLQTRCGLNMRSYPFDSQSCTIRISSWIYGDSRVFYSINDSYIEVSDYTSNPIWTLDIENSGLDLTVKSDRIPFLNDNSTEIDVIISLKRKPLYYMINSIFPCLILNIVSLILLFMPASNAFAICKFKINKIIKTINFTFFK